MDTSNNHVDAATRPPDAIASNHLHRDDESSDHPRPRDEPTSNPEIKSEATQDEKSEDKPIPNLEHSSVPKPPTELPRLALVTDIQIPQSFDFPSSPPGVSAKPRYNSAVVDEFDPLAKPVARAPVSVKPQTPTTQARPQTPSAQARPQTPGGQGQPQTPIAQGRPQTPTAPGRPPPQAQTSRAPPNAADQPDQRPPTPTSAPATVATFPSIASIARSFISRPSSPVTTGRPELPSGSPKTKASPLPQSPATRTRPAQSSALSASTSATAVASEPPDPEQFDFPRFLEQLKSRPADPVARYLRSFLHNFSKKTFTVNDQIKLVHDFLVFISARMQECEIWKRANEVEFDNAVEGMEKLVMNRLYEYTFTPQIARSGRPVTTDDLERDRVLKQRIGLFQWIRPEHLDIPMKLKEENEPSQESLSPASTEKSTDSEISMGFLLFAQQEMNKIDHYKAPRDKLICVLNSCKVIFGLIRHLRGDEGADSFIPLLIFVLIRANPEHLLSNIEYINRFRRASKLQSEAGYYLSSLMGAVSFIETMDHTSLSNITQQEFEKNVEQAIQALPPSPDPSSPASGPAFVSSRSTASDLSQFSSAPASSSIGEESARTLQLPQVAAIAEDTRRFLERTGESLSKPLSAIGRIFSEVLDDEPPRSPSSGYPGASVRPQPPYRTRPGAPNEQNQGLLPPLQFSSLGMDLSNPTTPNSGHTPPRAPTPLDFSAMQAEIDRAHAAALDAARATLHQIFPAVDKEVADMVLEANNGDLGLSIEKLLEMAAG